MMTADPGKESQATDAMDLRLIRDASEITADRVSAVFMIAFDGERMLAIQNERGWDIPGGYLEAGESVEEALRRELIEEGGAHVERQIPFALLGKPTAAKVMLLYTGWGITLGEFVQKPDALGREVMDVEELIRRYYGDRKMLRRLIEAARARVSAEKESDLAHSLQRR
jgi:ADP-ribose pyrophosphatase YjhB (NUDIX family)